MKLHRLIMKNFRGVAGREVVFPDSGVIVVEGANETGKSSMIEALDLLLEEKDGSGKAQVKSIKPVNVDAGSVVEAEISTGPYRFSYRKQWNRGAATTLTVMAPNRAQYTGVQAHERVRAMLSETVDDKLFKALRILQATPMDQANLGESSALVSALDRAAGAADDDSGGETLIAAVESEYRRFFTATGRPTGSYRTAQERVRHAAERADATRERLEEVGRDAEILQELIARCHELEAGKGAAEHQVSTAGTEWERVEQLQLAFDAAVRLAEAEAVTLSGAERDQQARSSLVQELERRKQLVGRLQTGVEAATAALDGLRESMAEVEREAAEQESTVLAARTEAGRARADLDHLHDIATLNRLIGRITEIDMCRAEMESALGVIAATAVDTAALRAIERAGHDVDLAMTKQLAAAGQLTIEPLTSIAVDVAGTRQDLNRGELIERVVTDEIHVLVPDVIRLTVRPAGAALELAEAVAVARRDLTARLSDAKAEDLAHARGLHERRRDAQAASTRAQQRSSDLLGDEAYEQLLERRSELRDEIVRFKSGRVGTSKLPDSPSSARDISRVADAAQVEAERTAKDALDRLSALRSRFNVLSIELAKTDAWMTSQLDEYESAQGRLTAARDYATDAELASAVLSARAVAEQASRALAHVKSQLVAADPEAAGLRLREAKAAASRCVQEIADNVTETIRLRARLEVIGSEGRQDSFDAALTAVAAAERDHRRIRDRASAAALLFHTMRDHRLKAKAQYVAPFTGHVVRLGRILHGPDFGVDIDSDLRIISRTVDGVTVGFEVLSTGAKEQLAIMTRLACAAVVGGDVGVPVIIDDALGYSDPERLRRMGAILSGAGADSQVILLTCTPDRYRGIAASATIRLDSAAPRHAADDGAGAGVGTAAEGKTIGAIGDRVGAKELIHLVRGKDLADPGASSDEDIDADADRASGPPSHGSGSRRRGVRMWEPVTAEPGLFAVPSSSAAAAPERVRPPMRRRGVTHSRR